MIMSMTQPPRLLLVEDDLDTASLILETLADHFGPGNVLHITNLSDANQVDLNQIDLVLSDMNLPDGTGLELLGRLLTRRPDLPVVLVTGESILENAITAIRQGAYDYVLKAGDYLFAIPVIVEKNLALWRVKQENHCLNAKLKQTIEEVNVKNRQLEQAVQQLQTMAATDPLTGLANRRAFNQALGRYFADAVRQGNDLAIIMVDMDNFKKLNDTLGHQRGDEILQAMARCLQASCRASDVIGRFGGDEFVVVLPQTDPLVARQVGQRIFDSFNHHLSHGAGRDAAACDVSLSMGVACMSLTRPQSPDQLLAQADHALYRAKQQGKSRSSTYGAKDQPIPVEALVR